MWNSGAEEGGGNLGYKPRYKEGYFPVPPMDHYQDLRSEMVLTLRELGIPVEVHHHEVGTAGQAEIDTGFAPLLTMADRLMLYKYTVKNIALKYGKTVTFMPKPIFQDNGSGMHVHQSLVEGRRAACSGTSSVTRSSRTPRAGTSAESSNTPRRCSRCVRRRPTRTSDSCRATRLL